MLGDPVRELVRDDVEVLAQWREQAARSVPASVAVDHLAVQRGPEGGRTVVAAPESVVEALSEVSGRAEGVAGVVVRVAAEGAREVVVDPARVDVRLLDDHITDRSIVFVPD